MDIDLKFVVIAIRHSLPATLIAITTSTGMLTILSLAYQKFLFLKQKSNSGSNLLKKSKFERASRGEYDRVINQIEQGQTITTEIDRTTVTLGGLFEVGASFADDGALITSDQNFMRLFTRKQPSMVSLGVINLKEGTDAEQVRTYLNNHLPDDVKAYTYEEYVDGEVAYIQGRTPIGFVFTLGTMMGFIVGIVIVYQVLSTDVNDHMAEYATFKAMGYKNSYFYSE